MKTTMRLFCLALLLGVLTSGLRATAPVEEKAFVFLGQTFDADYLTMDYELKYGGMVELRVFTEAGDLVWQNQYINSRGENRIRLRASAFETGILYTIQLDFKEDTHRLNVERK